MVDRCILNYIVSLLKKNELKCRYVNNAVDIERLKLSVIKEYGKSIHTGMQIINNATIIIM